MMVIPRNPGVYNKIRQVSNVSLNLLRALEDYSSWCNLFRRRASTGLGANHKQTTGGP